MFFSKKSSSEIPQHFNPPQGYHAPQGSRQYHRLQASVVYESNPKQAIFESTQRRRRTTPCFLPHVSDWRYLHVLSCCGCFGRSATKSWCRLVRQQTAIGSGCVIGALVALHTFGDRITGAVQCLQCFMPQTKTLLT